MKTGVFANPLEFGNRMAMFNHGEIHVVQCKISSHILTILLKIVGIDSFKFGITMVE